MNTESSADSQSRCENIQRQLFELVLHLRSEVTRVSEPRFQALLETTAEVLTGLRSAFQQYGDQRDRAGGNGAARDPAS